MTRQKQNKNRIKFLSNNDTEQRRARMLLRDQTNQKTKNGRKSFFKHYIQIDNHVTTLLWKNKGKKMRENLLEHRMCKNIKTTLETHRNV